MISATMSSEVVKLAGTLLCNAVHITIAPEQPAVERIEQKVFFVGKKSKNTLLASLLDDSVLNRVLVFTRMKHTANKVADFGCLTITYSSSYNNFFFK